MNNFKGKRKDFFMHAIFMVLSFALPLNVFAAAGDVWWDNAWPYRIPVTVSGSGMAQVSVNFTTTFSSLGLNNGLLDVRSIRVVPYSGSTRNPDRLSGLHFHVTRKAVPRVTFRKTKGDWANQDQCADQSGKQVTGLVMSSRNLSDWV